jgi:hypothetical protein
MLRCSGLAAAPCIGRRTLLAEDAKYPSRECVCICRLQQQQGCCLCDSVAVCKGCWLQMFVCLSSPALVCSPQKMNWRVDMRRARGMCVWWSPCGRCRQAGYCGGVSGSQQTLLLLSHVQEAW